MTAAAAGLGVDADPAGSMSEPAALQQYLSTPASLGAQKQRRLTAASYGGRFTDVAGWEAATARRRRATTVAVR
jgi:hypothetical protein